MGYLEEILDVSQLPNRRVLFFRGHKLSENASIILRNLADHYTDLTTTELQTILDVLKKNLFYYKGADKQRYTELYLKYYDIKDVNIHSLKIEDFEPLLNYLKKEKELYFKRVQLKSARRIIDRIIIKTTNKLRSDIDEEQELTIGLLLEMCTNALYKVNKGLTIEDENQFFETFNEVEEDCNQIVSYCDSYCNDTLEYFQKLADRFWNIF